MLPGLPVRRAETLSFHRHFPAQRYFEAATARHDCRRYLPSMYSATQYVLGTLSPPLAAGAEERCAQHIGTSIQMRQLRHWMLLINYLLISGFILTKADEDFTITRHCTRFHCLSLQPLESSLIAAMPLNFKEQVSLPCHTQARLDSTRPSRAHLTGSSHGQIPRLAGLMAG